MPGLFGSLLVGVSGLHGNSTRMGTISDNIANVSTVGYKKADTQFQTLVTSRIQSTSYSPGGVLARPRQLVDQQGVITSSARSTHIAISGNGLFVVSDETSNSLNSSRVYTRSGAFRPDNAGFLQNTAGYYLKGWATNSEGQVIDPSSKTVLTSPGSTDLITVSVTDQEAAGVDIEQSVRATTEMTSKAVLPAELTQQGLPLSIFDNSGNLQQTLVGSETVTVGAAPTVTLADGTGATVALNLAAVLGAEQLRTVTTGETFTVTDSAGTVFDITSMSGFSGSIANFVAGFNASAEAVAAGLTAVNNGDGTITINGAGPAAPGVAAAGAAGANTATIATTVEGLANAINAMADQVSGARTFDFSATFTGGQLSISVVEENADGSTSQQQIVGLTDITVDTAPQNVTANNLSIAINQTTAAGGGVVGTIDLSGVTSIQGLTLDSEAFIAAINALGTQTDNLGDSYTLTAAANAAGQVAITATRTATVGGRALGAVPTASTGLTYADRATLRAGTATGAFGEDFSAATTVSQTVQVYDSLGAPHKVTYNWMRRVDEPNLWEVRLTEADVTGLNTGGANPTGAEFDGTNPTAGGVRFAVALQGNTATAEFTQRLFVKFNGDGSMQEVRVTRDGNAGETLEGTAVTTGLAANRETDATQPPKIISVAIGPVASTTFQTNAADGAPFATGDIDANPPFSSNNSDGSTVPTSANALTYEWSIGTPVNANQGGGTGLNGITQFNSGEETPIITGDGTVQNGARVGNLIGVEVQQSGLVYGIYDNGLSQPIWQLAVADFANPNGLINRSGNVYAEGPDSGTVQLRLPGESGAGKILGSAVEQSNVDLGDEFTNMIITQQAFTANTRTVTTSDQMLEELVRILR